MAAGYISGGVCVLSAQQAAAEACSRAQGVTSSGMLACTGYSVDGTTATLTLSSGSSFGVPLLACDRPTLADTWAPLWGAMVVASIVVWGLRGLVDVFRSGRDE